jgi:hypothetical protein
MVLADFGVGQVLWSMLWFFLIFIWIMLLFRVFADIFRDREMGGVAKTLWILFVIITPYLGVFVYLIARGHKMVQNDVADAQAADAAMQEYIRNATGGAASPAAELARLGELKEKGLIDDAEFAAAKAKLLG